MEIHVACLSEHKTFVQPGMVVQYAQADLALKVTAELVEKTAVAGFDSQASQHLKDNPALQAETVEILMEQIAVLAALELAETAVEEISHDTVIQNSYKRTMI
jgi:hypothetical protein